MRVAVVGVWHVHTHEYAKAIQENPKAELVCCWDEDAEKGQAFAAEMGIHFVPTLSEILEDETIDSIQVTTSTNLHHEVLIAAAKANKNIFTEKVLTFTNEEAEEVRAAVRASGGKFTISFPHKTFPALQAAKKLVDDGKIGKITYGRVRNVHGGSIANWLPDTFYNEAQTGGGAMMDLGAHPMYTLNWFLGEPKSMVSLFTKVTNRSVEDNAVSVIEFPDGAIAVSETGFVSDGNPYTLEMSGTEGAILVHQGTLEYCSASDTNRDWVKMETLPEALPLPIYTWMDAVENGTEPPEEYNIDQAVALTNFMVGAYHAYKTGKKYEF